MKKRLLVMITVCLLTTHAGHSVFGDRQKEGAEKKQQTESESENRTSKTESEEKSPVVRGDITDEEAEVLLDLLNENFDAEVRLLAQGKVHPGNDLILVVVFKKKWVTKHIYVERILRLHNIGNKFARTQRKVKKNEDKYIRAGRWYTSKDNKGTVDRMFAGEFDGKEVDTYLYKGVTEQEVKKLFRAIAAGDYSYSDHSLKQADDLDLASVSRVKKKQKDGDTKFVVETTGKSGLSGQCYCFRYKDGELVFSSVSHWVS